MRATSMRNNKQNHMCACNNRQWHRGPADTPRRRIESEPPTSRALARRALPDEASDKWLHNCGAHANADLRAARAGRRTMAVPRDAVWRWGFAHGLRSSRWTGTADAIVSSHVVTRPPRSPGSRESGWVGKTATRSAAALSIHSSLPSTTALRNNLRVQVRGNARRHPRSSTCRPP